MARSEAELLSDCIESGKLDEKSLGAFEEWLEKFRSGAWRKPLSASQRQWLDDACEALGIDPGAENLVSSGKMKVTDAEREGLKTFVEGLGPKPLKPPKPRREL